MKHGKRLIAVTATLGMLVAVAVPAFAADATVGRFIQQLAKVKNLNATDAQIALDSLQAVGVRLPAGIELGKRLTEADVAVISRAAGLRVTSSNPDAPFTEEKVERFFLSFASELASGSEGDAFATTDENPGAGSGPGNGESGPPFDPFSKGKGNGKGKGKGSETPTEPE